MEYPTLFTLTILLLSMLITSSSAQLRQDFYKNICPDVESIVSDAVRLKLSQTIITAPATLRLFAHDCFVEGCDASILLASPNAEKDNPDDLTLAGDGFDTVIKAKAALDNDPTCRNKVSCADILALATRDVVAMTGGPSYAVELGRLDGRSSTEASVDGQLPHADFNLDQLNSMFALHGLTQTDMIALSGAHTIGFSHCNQFSTRIFNFGSSNGVDPSMNPTYASDLQQECPIGVDPSVVVNLDPTTPNTFDNTYYTNLQQGKGLFTSDQILFTDTRSTNTVNLFADNITAFEEAYVTAITKLGRVGVKTGNQGEIRRDCTSVN
ncbi:hypothetical protein GIB67_023368 [Kingdonia uniflora]|uniref:Peroxidase n=1 Tax=Kingdonia uniflora TaxID=39325 RepID=A0A7J7LI76_9MAGN|nr:hypothetical protein GIB67_023368 [Kingdonia uniflora]